MRRVFLLLGVCFVMAMMIAPAAGAKTLGGPAPIMGGAPFSPPYVLESDGTVIDGGDVVTDCSSFAAGGVQQYVQGRSQDEAQAVADKCQQLGYPSGDGTVGNSDIVLNLGTVGPPAPIDTGGTEVLPDTGGLPLALMGTLAGGLALIGFGGLALKRASNYR